MVIDPEEYELQLLLDRLPRLDPCHVVEVGCGDGRLTRRYSGSVTSVLAIDSDEAALGAFAAAGIPPNVQLRAVSIDKLELPAGSVAAVLFSWAL